MKQNHEYIRLESIRLLIYKSEYDLDLIEALVADSFVKLMSNPIFNHLSTQYFIASFSLSSSRL